MTGSFAMPLIFSRSPDIFIVHSRSESPSSHPSQRHIRIGLRRYNSLQRRCEKMARGVCSQKSAGERKTSRLKICWSDLVSLSTRKVPEQNAGYRLLVLSGLKSCADQPYEFLREICKLEPDAPLTSGGVIGYHF